MSDEDYETTAVAVAKPKKERTPAQKAATARALEALAAAREAKKAEKAKPPTVVKRTTTTTKTVAATKPARNVVTYDEEPTEEAPVYVKAVAKPRAAVPSAPDYGADIRSLTEGLHGVLTYIEKKETKKQSKSRARPPPPESSSEEEDYPEPAPVRRKSKLSKAAPPAPEYQFGHKDPQEVLRSLFFRNN
jgi:hypothetical protein